MSAESYIYVLAAIATALMTYLATRSDETVRQWMRRQQERKQERAKHGSGWGWLFVAMLAVGAGMISPVLGVVVWIWFGLVYLTAKA